VHSKTSPSTSGRAIVNIAAPHGRAIHGRGHARAAHAEKAWRRAAARTRARVSMIEMHDFKERRAANVRAARRPNVGHRNE
jgi:hypothetical protein